MKDGLRSISLAARRAPSVGFVRLVAGVIQKMLRLSDHESNSAKGLALAAILQVRNIVPGALTPVLAMTRDFNGFALSRQFGLANCKEGWPPFVTCTVAQPS
jgi:hypothetical protein